MNDDISRGLWQDVAAHDWYPYFRSPHPVYWQEPYMTDEHWIAKQIREEREEAEAKATDDQVNHPSHYNSHPSGVECIDIVRHMTFNVGNVFKYLWRNGLKDGEPSLKDMRKAEFYLRDEIARVEAEQAAGRTTQATPSFNCVNLHVQNDTHGNRSFAFLADTTVAECARSVAKSYGYASARKFTLVFVPQDIPSYTPNWSGSLIKDLVEEYGNSVRLGEIGA